MPTLAPVRKRVRVIVAGDVQGVGFRWYCREEAMSREVSGFVRNLGDGRVEATFEGEPSQVDAMVEWCHHGPRSADVDHLEVEEEWPEGEETFEIRR
jgi:acylphosphatase